MPVPVPRYSKPPSHPVLKQVVTSDAYSNSFQSLACTLPVSPTGPPPSFGTREQWINSLPTWRRTKPRRIWEEDTRSADHPVEQDFFRGLTGAGNAPVIKGTHAEASTPPLYNLLVAGQPPEEMALGPLRDADEINSDNTSSMEQSRFETRSQWSAPSPMRIDDDGMVLAAQVQESSVVSVITDLTSFDKEPHSYTPIFEDDKSPGAASGPDRDSSPLQPITPFGVYVDRAITSHAYEGTHSNDVVAQNDAYQNKLRGPQCYPVEPVYQAPSQTQERAPVSAPEVATPCATTAYKKLAEPLADWVANYVWKVCTTGLSLSTTFTQSIGSSATAYPNSRPGYLTASVHSLFLSTLLQPSAVFLALWYITRLPVYLDAAPFEHESKEAKFRAALLGDSFNVLDKEVAEASAPFRLVVLGCMLANKWLDDHTFSNKTWHNITNVPIQALNKLESLALEIFTYDLTISSRDWSQWLSHLRSYHMSLASPMHSQPISRPSTNPHSIVRRAIDEIIQAPVASHTSSVPQPVFVGLEERKREKAEKEQALVSEVLEIDLDKDGPLREEYLPKRRVSAPGSHYILKANQPLGVVSNLVPPAQSWERRDIHDLEKSLPPPAKWSPAGDEPIIRERPRVSGQYVAVQPPILHVAAPYPAPYHPPVDVYAHYHWNTATYAPIKPQSNYVFDFSVISSARHQMPYNTYPYVPQIPISHARSQSLSSYDDENFHARQHIRTYSQSRFEYQCSDLRMTANEFIPHRQGENAWMGASHYQYHGGAFAPIHNVNHQQAWLRT
ncbi:hypothetical protein C0989_001838 [Termitomyces sp. Mn162]|nr:hypothetical protein C0989_001838 [Termitomyces sp. Mn162]